MAVQTQPPKQTDDPDLFKALSQRPNVAWPTVMLLAAAYVIFGVSTYAYIQGALSLFWAIVINTIASYMSFTPAHDATHSAVSSNRQLNDWVGRIATALQSPVPFFRTFRYIHMQHHRFTNDKNKDPDIYVGSGPAWLLPFKWATLDLNYFYYYFMKAGFMTRPQSERRELYIALLFSVVIIITFFIMGGLGYYVLLFLVPQRFTALMLASTFDFLPHYPHNSPHQANAKDQPFQCTSNRIGMEWLLTPLLLYQNYHLVHHLYPTVPFYRYIKVWNAKKNYHEAQQPATTSPFGLRPG